MHRDAILAALGVVGLALALGHPPVGAQSNPCTASPPTVVELNPTKVWAPIPEFPVAEADGTPRITDFQIAYFKSGEAPDTAATPVQGPSTMPKTSWALVTGTPDCYVSNLTLPIPASVSLQAFIRPHRAKTAALPEAFGPWSAASNPFAVAPSTLAQLKVLLVGR